MVITELIIEIIDDHATEAEAIQLCKNIIFTFSGRFAGSRARGRVRLQLLPVGPILVLLYGKFNFLLSWCYNVQKLYTAAEEYSCRLTKAEIGSPGSWQ